MPGRTGSRLATDAEERLRRVVARWSIVPPRDGVQASGADVATADADTTGGSDDAPVADRSISVGPWSRPALRGLVLLVAIVVAVAAYWAWTGRPRAIAVAASGPAAAAVSVPPSPVAESTAESTAATSAPVPSAPPAELVVHVIGQVRNPGLVHLPAGSRVADAIAAAGGPTHARAADTVNLARIVVDGEQIAVGVDGSPDSAPSAVGMPTAPLDLNAASVEALDALPGIGPVLAGRIVAWRQANGRFRSVAELGEVAGIGDAILRQISDLVRV